MATSCPDLSAWVARFLRDDFIFFVEGILLMGVSTVGISFNALFALVLSRKELRNSFNSLLLALALIDSTYLAGAWLESLRKGFKRASMLHIELFPKLLYPVQGIALSASIFMTVAISFERYVAVHNPINYNRAMNDAKATRARMVRFLVPVLLLALMVSSPKFFEATISYDERLWPQINFTDFRIHPTYTRFINYSELMVQGLLPVALLTYFNTKVYKDVMERRRRLKPAWNSNGAPRGLAPPCRRGKRRETII